MTTEKTAEITAEDLTREVRANIAPEIAEYRQVRNDTALVWVGCTTATAAATVISRRYLPLPAAVSVVAGACGVSGILTGFRTMDLLEAGKALFRAVHRERDALLAERDRLPEDIRTLREAATKTEDTTRRKHLTARAEALTARLAALAEWSGDVERSSR